MQAHSDLHVYPFRPEVRGEIALRVDGGRDRVLRAPERDEEGVALRVDLVSAVRRECLPQDALVVGEHLGVCAAEPLDEAVEPSMSVKRNVTVPLGSSGTAEA